MFLQSTYIMILGWNPSLQSGIRETVSRGGAAFDDANRAREDAFALCCARIGEGVDEADLDAKVAAALAALARIEEGYRAYHAETTGDVEAYPDAMNSASAAHRTAFEGLLEVKQGASERAGSLEIQANKSGGIVVDSQAGKHAAAATALYEKLFVDESKAKNTSDTSKETPQGEGSASQTEEVKTNPVAPEKKEADQLKRAASKKEPAKKVSDGTKTKAGGKVTPAPVVTPEPTASPPVASSPVPTGDPTPEKSATEPAGDTCPVGVDGQPYLSTLLLSRGELAGKTVTCADVGRPSSEISGAGLTAVCFACQQCLQEWGAKKFSNQSGRRALWARRNVVVVF